MSGRSLSEQAEAIELRLSFQKGLVAWYRMEVFALNRSVTRWKRLAIERGLEVERLQKQLRREDAP